MKSTFNINNGLPIGVNPLNESHTATIKYRASGLILSDNLNFDNEINRILNLNTKYLKDLRREKWQLIFKSCYRNGNVNKVKLKKILSSEFNGRVFKLPFPGLSEFLLKKYT